MTQEKLSFQTEVQQLLNLMIHSLYSNRDIFLRELISNGSDALDKLRYEEAQNSSLKASGDKKIHLTVLPKENKLVIEDTGVGMTRDELIANLGTIASSGTKKFLEKLKEDEKNSAQLIGQFGVGFYSAFMVAKKVVVETRSVKEEKGYVWESEGDGTYTLDTFGKDTNGTRIEVHLKDDALEYLEEHKVRSIVKKYSDYVAYPIMLTPMETENKEEEEAPKEPEQLNSTVPVWAKAKSENKPEDYHALYKQLSFDFEEPLTYEHMNIEGNLNFKSVFFIPKRQPFDLFTNRDSNGLHLYVKRVSIDEQCKDLMPEYLRFIKGVVETDELPLNVSREILQENRKIPVIKNQIVKRVFKVLKEMAKKDTEKFEEFYNNFGQVLKEGFYFDHANHESLAEIVRFKSTKTGADKWVTFAEYVARFAENQKDIYYTIARNYESALSSPHLEALTSRGIEVLVLTDQIDEFFLQHFPKYKDHKLVNASESDLDLKEVGEKKEKEDSNTESASEKELAGVMSTIKSRYETELKDVKISDRLTESPVCLVRDANALSPQMEQLMKASGQEVPAQKKIMELNPKHPLIRNICSMASGGQNEKVDSWIDLLYDTAVVAEGAQLKNPGEFAKKLAKALEGVGVGQQQ